MSGKKTPIYKKWWFWVIVAFIGSAAIAGIIGGPSEPTKSDVNDTQDQLEEVEDEVLESMKLHPTSVHNDITGNWRISTIASTEKNFEQHAINYYKKFFKSDDEVHFIVNFTYNTTTNITKYGNLIYVTTKEYVKGEEHDAQKLGSGMVLTNYVVNIDTGEIEKF